MKTAIVYYSKHHGNTLKLLEALKAKDPDIVMIDVLGNPDPDLSSFDVIGAASGIYSSKFAKQLTTFLRQNLPSSRKVFALYSCGQLRPGYTDEIKSIASERSCEYLGEYGCLGFDTFGPFKLIGGLAKGHPTAAEIEGAVIFYEHKVKQET